MHNIQRRRKGNNTPPDKTMNDLTDNKNPLSFKAGDCIWNAIVCIYIYVDIGLISI